LHFKLIFDHFLKKVVKGPPSPVQSVLVKLRQSLARVKTWRRSTPYKLKYGIPKNAFSVGTIPHLDLQGHSTELHQIVLPNVKGIAVERETHRFWIFLWVPEIFAAELQSRPKSGQILHVFGS